MYKSMSVSYIYTIHLQRHPSNWMLCVQLGYTRWTWIIRRGMR